MKKWVAIGVSFHFLVGCTTSSKGIDISQEPVLRHTPEQTDQITIRELGADGRISLRRVSRDALLSEQGTRIFQLKYIGPPAIDLNDPQGRIEDWELFSVVESLLTRDIRWRNVGSVKFDSSIACFIVRDSLPVLDRIGDLISGLDGDSPSVRLQELLRAREEQELEDFAARGGVPYTKAAHKVQEQGHLKLGRIPELVKKVSEAVASRSQEQSQREVLRGPLLDLRDEIDRIHKVPRAPHEY